MSKPTFLSPGSVVRVTNSPVFTENGAIGFVRRSKPAGNDDVLVKILDGAYAGYSLSYKSSSLSPVE